MKVHSKSSSRRLRLKGSSYEGKKNIAATFLISIGIYRLVMTPYSNADAIISLMLNCGGA